MVTVFTRTVEVEHSTVSYNIDPKTGRAIVRQQESIAFEVKQDGNGTLTYRITRNQPATGRNQTVLDLAKGIAVGGIAGYIIGRIIHYTLVEPCEAEAIEDIAQYVLKHSLADLGSAIETGTKSLFQLSQKLGMDPSILMA